MLVFIHALVTWLAAGGGKWISGRISEELLYRIIDGAGRFGALHPLQLQRAGGRRSGRMALRGELGCRRTRTR
ncbi:MAG: hypothetical protein VKN56_10250 [Cyanobacteriota bacterium]|nr:hypothetical protein [Cyanobacteriota bacterium]